MAKRQKRRRKANDRHKSCRQIAPVSEGILIAQRQASCDEKKSGGESGAAHAAGRLQRVQADPDVPHCETEGRLSTEQVAARTDAQQGDLAALYAASTRLQATQGRDDVLAAIREIAVNLIGVAEMGVFAFDAQTSTLLLIDGIGSEPASYHGLLTGNGPIGQAVLNGYSHFHDLNEARQTSEADMPIACIPLNVEAKAWGVIVIFRLLPQKDRLVLRDYQLVELLSSQAAIALHRTGTAGYR